MTFPILYAGGLAKRLLRECPDWPRSVPFAMVAQHRSRVMAVAGHEVEQLARTGGLAPQALVAVLDGVPLSEARQMPLTDAVARVQQHMADFAAALAAEMITFAASTDGDTDG